MSYSELRNTYREKNTIKSIEIMRKDGIDDEIIKKKMMESFSLDEETIDSLLKG